jgi:hypothetical protein
MNTNDPAAQTGSPQDGEPTPTGWVRLQPEDRDQLLDALDVAADWMENDLDCGDCTDRSCVDDDHIRFMDKVHQWRALARHLDATGPDPYQPGLPPAVADVDQYHGQRPRLGPVMLDVTTSEPDALGRLFTGQVFGEGRGVFYALNSARRLACRHGTVSVVVTEYRRPDQRVLFRHGVAGKPDIDVTPWCPRCGTKHCTDMSVHYDAIESYLAAWADAHEASGDGEPDSSLLSQPAPRPVGAVPAVVNGFPVIAAWPASVSESRWWVICRRTEPAYASGPTPLYVVWTAWVDADGVGQGQNGNYGPGHGLTFDQAQQALLDRAGYTHRTPATTAVTREGSIVIDGERIDLWARRAGPGLLEVDLCTAAGFGCGEAKFALGELTMSLPDGWPVPDQVRVACLITQIAFYGIARRWEPDPADEPR